MIDLSRKEIITVLAHVSLALSGIEIAQSKTRVIIDGYGLSLPSNIYSNLSQSHIWLLELREMLEKELEE